MKTPDTTGPSGKGILKIKTFKVPITIEDGKVQEKPVELTDEMLVGEPEEVEMKSPVLELPTLTKKIGQFNQRQVKYAEEGLIKDYIKRKIITK